MYLLKHNNFEFKNIISNGFAILPEEYQVITEIEMADGSVKRNYKEKTKTTIRVTFGRLNRELYRQYISHFILPEDVYEYYDTYTGEYKKKRFFVKRNADILNFINDIDEWHEEFEIELQQCGEA